MCNRGAEGLPVPVAEMIDANDADTILGHDRLSNTCMNADCVTCDHLHPHSQETIFKLWGDSGVRSDYRQRVHALLKLLCPEGLPGVFSASKKRRRLESAKGDATASQDFATSELQSIQASKKASQVRGQLWAGKTNIVKFVSDL